MVLHSIHLGFADAIGLASINAIRFTETSTTSIYRCRLVSAGILFGLACSRRERFVVPREDRVSSRGGWEASGNLLLVYTCQLPSLLEERMR
jgi:hypothetical protein